MLEIQPEPWQLLVAHAEASYPRECCGVLLGTQANGIKSATKALALDNVYDGPQEDRYEIRPADLLRAERDARAQGLDILAIFHSHPDCDAYFSATDLKHSCPWYSFLVVSIRQGRFHHANSFLPNADQTEAPAEPLRHP